MNHLWGILSGRKKLTHNHQLGQIWEAKHQSDATDDGWDSVKFQDFIYFSPVFQQSQWQTSVLTPKMSQLITLFLCARQAWKWQRLI